MNEIGEGATCPAEMLLREIERQMREEMRIIDEAAEREARTILAQAHAAARRRMRDAVNDR
jgi:vacuolar-type H+-ATPase subunit E/Vma4